MIRKVATIEEKHHKIDLQMLSSATLYANVFVKGGTGEGH